jgi:hypothetical protein
MVADQETQSIEFSGSAKSKKLASLAFDVMRGHGMFMSDNSPIRVPLDALAAFLNAQAEASASEVEAAISGNRAVFSTEVENDVTYVVTTRRGQAPGAPVVQPNHTFQARFLTPEPKPVAPVVPRRERARVDPSWASFQLSDYAHLDEEEDEAEDEIVEATPVTIGADDIDLIFEPLESETRSSTPAAVEEPAPAVEPGPVAAETVTPAPAEVATPAETAVPAPAPIDLDRFTGEDLASAIHARLAADVHVAQFGDQWMSEDRVPRLSRGDLRRIKDYIEEQEQPLTDATLVQDILGIRANAVDFGLMQFAVNFRLSREHRDFDFVGTNEQRFWSTTNLAPIGTTRRKPNEIGTDFRFLIDEVADQVVAPRSVKSIDHIVTFYEYNLGLLPYDLDMQRLFPRPVNPEQRSAVLTFEIPQLYTTYLAELRYPTPNRGGFLLGLDDFYSESLVPGAIIAITATENDGHYKVEFISTKNRSERLLELDDRRQPRYLYRPTSFACDVADEWLISEDRFPTLGSEKPLDDKTRRRPEAVIEATFQRVGISDGEGGLLSSFADLLAAANVERPFSEALMRTTLEQHPSITGEGDTFTYEPGS